MKLSFRSKWVLAFILAASVYSFGILLFACIQANTFWSVNLPLRNVQHLDGNEWAATPIYSSKFSGWLLYIPTDSSANPKVSDVRVMDANGELGPAHSRHADIVTLGAGLYSYWEHMLRFSTRDNLPPVMASGRLSISVAAAPRLLPVYVWVALLGAIAIVFIIYVRFRSAVFWKQVRVWPAITAFALFYYGWLLFHIPVGVGLSPDSYTYLLFHPDRTAGYPLLIHLLIVIGSPYYIVLAQFLLAAVAISFFSRELESTFSPIIVSIIAVLLVIKGDINALHYFLLTDSIAFSSVLVLTTLWLRFIRAQTPVVAWSIMVVLIISVLIRPALFALVVPTILLAVCFYRRSKVPAVILTFACIIAPFANVPLQWIAARALEHSDLDHYVQTVYADDSDGYHTPFWQVDGRVDDLILGESLLQEVRFAITADQPTQYPQLTRAIVAARDKVQGEFYKSDKWQKKYEIYESTHQDGVVSNVVGQALEKKCSPSLQVCAREWYVSLDKLKRVISFETIEAHPMACLYLTEIKLMHAATETMMGYWARGNVTTYSGSGAITPFVWHKRYGLDFSEFNIARPFFIESDIDAVMKPLLPWLFVGSIVYGAFFVLLLFKVLPFDKRIFSIGIISIAGVSYTLLVCLLAPPIDRYGVPAAPLYLTVLFGTVDIVLQGITQHSDRIRSICMRVHRNASAVASDTLRRIRSRQYRQ
jgi:hypothetical protein